MEPVSILITGGCGFVGINLVDHLLSRFPCKITLLDDGSNSVPENLEAVWNNSQPAAVRFGSPKPRVITANVCDREATRRAIAGADAVVHLAAFTRVVESLQNPDECYRVNIMGTINVLEACREHKVGRFVLASSNAAVGDANAAVDETMAPRPLSPYGATKLAGEALCSAYANSYGMATVALRFSNAYGPYCQKKSSVVALFMRTMLAGKPLTIYGDGRQTRDFIHVADICWVIGSCLESRDDVGKAKFAGETFQVATGIETSVLQLVSALNRATGQAPKLVYAPPRAGEIIRNRSNIAKLRATLNYSPQVDLEAGIAALYQWFQRAGAATA